MAKSQNPNKPAERARLTEGPVAKQIISMTIPMILGMLGMAAFNIADTLFIGRLGTKELAAISFTFPVVMVINSIAQGLGVGVSALVARYRGRQHAEDQASCN